ncbi:MAG: PH domain-containing protein [Acidimicrobiales bacterium]
MAPAGAPPAWCRLHPLSPLIRSSRTLAAIAVLAVVDAAQARHGNRMSLVVYGAVILFGLVAGVIAWLVTRWRLEPDALRIETGLFRRDSRRLPIDRIQAVDLVQPFLGRILGLAELRIRLAGADGSRGRLSYLSETDAHQLRARLLAAHHGLDPATPPPPERLLLSVPSGRLLMSVATSFLGSAAGVLAVVAVILSITVPSALAVVFGSSFSLLFALGSGIWRRVTSEYRFTAAAAPDGLRLRAGLFQTVAETIPAGRIQAVRMVEPLLWRPFGWCRVVVDVAGGAANRRGRTGGGGQVSRALLPVGLAADAELVLDRVLGDHRVPVTRPPRRARLKAPLGYHFLAAGYDRRHAVTVNGRLQRTTCWVPLEKVQSVRRLQGPVQRRLRVSSVHLDTAGRSVRAVLRDRDQNEADAEVEELTELCRTARAVHPPRPATVPVRAPSVQ